VKLGKDIIAVVPARLGLMMDAKAEPTARTMRSTPVRGTCPS
jgi:hypothetical protein